MSTLTNGKAGRWGWRGWILAGGFAVLASGLCYGGQARDYAYLFVQGRLTAQSAKRPVAGITLRLSSDAGVFETTTESDGRFTFEKLPVASFEVELRTPAGEVLKTVRDNEVVSPDRTRLDIQVAKAGGAGSSFRIVPGAERVDVEIPNPPPKWRKFWKEFVIFLGIALVFAL